MSERERPSVGRPRFLIAMSRATPETAEVEWIYVHTLDPYGVYPELPEECQQVGPEYFARSPGSDVREFWRFARGDARRPGEEAQIKVGLSGGT
jgi:hypothetical protein